MPTVDVIVHEDAIDDVVPTIRKLSLARNCLVVHDPNTRKVAGAAILELLRKDGLSAKEVIVERPDDGSVEKTIAQLESNDFLVGVGGTSVLDISKLAASKKGAKYLLFSTGLANSGIISRTASIYMKGRKESISVNLADAVIVDLTIISHAPNWMVPAGCGDLVIEATAIKDWQLGHEDTHEAYCESIGELEMSTLDQILNDAEEIRLRSTRGIKSLVDALILSGLGMAIWGSSRPSSGSEHLWSHWLDHNAEEKRLPPGRHGEQVGFGTLLMAKYHEAHNADWWSRTEHPEYQAESLMAFLRKVGAPTTLKEIGISENLATEAFVGAWEYRKERYTILHKRHPTTDDATKIIQELGM
jgi:glycerol-1-phosphate dehydrogenase [NAD(P)+]